MLQWRAAAWMLEAQVCAYCNKNILAQYVVMGVLRKKLFYFNNVRSLKTKRKICERDTEKLCVKAEALIASACVDLHQILEAGCSSLQTQKH